MRKSFLLLLALASINAHALVDYSEPVDAPKESAAPKSFQKMSKPAGPSGSRSLSWKSDLSLTTDYEAMEIEGSKYGILNLNAHVQTPFDVFFDASYWNASGDGGSQSGNPKLLIGFNWLRFGSSSDEARVDIYAGARLSSASKLGTSRTDKIIGAETTKRFGTFGLGIGYDVTLVGTPKNTDEHAIGNIGRISVSGGWMVSNDIQFEVEAENFSIAAGSDITRTNRLAEKVSFSTLSPKVSLGLASAVNLEFGARFRMKKPKEDAKLLEARVFDLHGANANSLFAGLNITI
ncbi:MAG: hypothetical protein H7336_12480 [Bacteriovorax sp.]|nr:hypothetical protein [Bacteriovorax sp.]